MKGGEQPCRPRAAGPCTKGCPRACSGDAVALAALAAVLSQLMRPETSPSLRPSPSSSARRSSMLR